MKASELINNLVKHIEVHGDQIIMLQIEDSRAQPERLIPEYNPDTYEPQAFCLQVR